MSHHKAIYRIYPDDECDYLPKSKWIKADEWISGWEERFDFNEALALAKIAYRSCKYPFIVMEVPCGGVRPRRCNAWIVDK